MRYNGHVRKGRTSRDFVSFRPSFMTYTFNLGKSSTSSAVILNFNSMMPSTRSLNSCGIEDHGLGVACPAGQSWSWMYSTSWSCRGGVLAKSWRSRVSSYDSGQRPTSGCFFCVDPGCEGLLDMCCLGTWVLWCTWTYSVETVCLDDSELRHGFIFYAFLTSFGFGIYRLIYERLDRQDKFQGRAS